MIFCTDYYNLSLGNLCSIKTIHMNPKLNAGDGRWWMGKFCYYSPLVCVSVLAFWDILAKTQGYAPTDYFGMSRRLDFVLVVVWMAEFFLASFWFCRYVLWCSNFWDDGRVGWEAGLPLVFYFVSLIGSIMYVATGGIIVGIVIFALSLVFFAVIMVIVVAAVALKIYLGRKMNRRYLEIILYKTRVRVPHFVFGFCV